MSHRSHVWEQLRTISAHLEHMSSHPLMESDAYDREHQQLQQSLHEYVDMWSAGAFMLPVSAHLEKRTHKLKNDLSNVQDGTIFCPGTRPSLLPQSVREVPDPVRGAVRSLRTRPALLPSPLRHVSNPVQHASPGHGRDPDA